MTIQFLYFSGCPSYKEGLKNLKQTLKELGLSQDFEIINIDSDAKAKQYHFIGSPTIKVNGKDIDVRAQEAKVTGYKGCRIYQTENGLQGTPAIEMIKNAIQQTQSNE